jgi:PAS domain S-box-containing protein
MSAEYMRLIEQRLDIKFQYVPDMPWKDAMERMKRWEIDMTTCVAVTPQRTNFWAFTEPYLTIPIVIASQMDVTYIGDMKELAGKNVAVVAGFALEEWIQKDYPGIKLVRAESALSGLEMLQRGEVFAYIDNLLIIGYFQSKMKITSIKIAGQTPYVHAQCMAVRKDWAPLAGILQKALASISESERNEIYRKWLPIRYELGFDYALFWKVLVVFLGVLLALLFWNRKLAREIRNRKRAEEALRESEMKFRAMVDTVPLAIHQTVGLEQITEYMNPTMVKLFGYTPEDIPAVEQWWPLAYPDENYRRTISEEWTSRVKRAIETQSPIEPMEVVVRCKDGTMKNILWGYITLGDKNYSCGLDLTERKRAEEALLVSLREKESMLKEIHHRVKNNLQIVSSLLNLQCNKMENSIAKAALRDMQNRVRSMALIHEHLYRSENLAAVDMTAYLKSLCSQLFRALVTRPGAIKLHMDMGVVQLGIDQAIPCGLLVNELVSNALKHAFPEGRAGGVRVELHPIEDGSLHLKVSDDGIGLPQDFAIRNLTSLGLMLANDLSRQIGGKLVVGPAATFEITFKPK